LITASLSLPGSVAAEAPKEITVSAAASLKDAFDEIGALYERTHPGTHIVFNFAASGVLQRQIEGGAPVDVFAAASPREMDALETRDLIVLGTRRAFARNEVVLIVPAKGRGAGITSFAGLAGPSVRRIAIGNPATVPAGAYAEQVLRHFGVWDALRERTVLAENVRQVTDYVARGEVDAGIVFATDAQARPGVISVVLAAPAVSHAPAVYHAAMVKGTEAEALARSFLAELGSAEGKAVLARRGFRPEP
jgi:molybdate transport system substrate-binding protein